MSIDLKKAQSHLQFISERVNLGLRPRVPIEIVMLWFGINRRGRLNVKEISDAFDDHNLRTDPDIEDIDESGEGAEVEFYSRDSLWDKSEFLIRELIRDSCFPHSFTLDSLLPNGFSSLKDPAPDQIVESNVLIVGASLEEATGAMLKCNLSHIPIVYDTDSMRLQGVLSWQALALSVGTQKARTSIQDLIEISPQKRKRGYPLRYVLDQVLDQGYVCVVGDDDATFQFMVTQRTLAAFFVTMARPTLLTMQMQERLIKSPSR